MSKFYRYQTRIKRANAEARRRFNIRARCRAFRSEVAIAHARARVARVVDTLLRAVQCCTQYREPLFFSSHRVHLHPAVICICRYTFYWKRHRMERKRRERTFAACLKSGKRTVESDPAAASAHASTSCVNIGNRVVSIAP